MFSMVKTRPNITFATLIKICFVKNLSHPLIEVVKKILKYFKGSKNRGITYKNEEKFIIKGYLELN